MFPEKNCSDDTRIGAGLRLVEPALCRSDIETRGRDFFGEGCPRMAETSVSFTCPKLGHASMDGFEECCLTVLSKLVKSPQSSSGSVVGGFVRAVGEVVEGKAFCGESNQDTSKESFLDCVFEAALSV
jgi:hypothetical protein